MSELCSLCKAVEAGPYCPASGIVHRPFAIAEHYEVQALLGHAQGSFVFGARDPQHGRWVAAALWHSHLTGEQVATVRAAQERFVREMAALDTRNRERAVGIIDFGWDDALGATYIVTCRVDDPMLQPTLEEVDAALTALDDSAAARTAPLVSQASVELPAMIGSYDVISWLGAGGTGRVYLGQHPLIGSKVAIKVLLPEIARSAETVDRFIQEARASSQIASPHIPRYFDFGTTADGLPYAIMEYFEGETLGVRLARVGTLSVSDTAQIVEQVASALLMAHEAGLVHRDLKPENLLLVTPDSKAKSSVRAAGSSAELARSTIVVKVLDFGIAKVVGSRSPNRTLSGSFLGTPYYCAPEQVFGHEVDARTDVYSLGATAFEMLTGAPPFVGAVPVILSSKATEEAPDLARRGIPPRVAHTIRRMLAREPKHRAPSMAWVLEEVASWLEPDRAREIDNPTDRITREEPTVVDWNPGGDRPAAIAHGSSEHLTPPRSPSAPTISNASTPAATSGMTTRDAIRAVSPPRARTWIALAVTAGALAIGAAAALLGGTSSSTASPASTHPASTPPASTPSTPPATTSVPTTPVDLPPANPPTQAAENPSTPSNTASPDVASPNTASPNMAMPNTPSQNATVQNTRSQRRPPKAPDKKPGKKPTTTKPGDSKDILIVDPFSSPRSDSP